MTESSFINILKAIQFKNMFLSLLFGWNSHVDEIQIAVEILRI